MTLASRTFAAAIAIFACGIGFAREPFDTSGLRLNQLQVIGSHNSYKQAIDAPLLRLMSLANGDARALDYAHPPLSEQLDLGLRALELDLFDDPDGGRYAAPQGLELQRRMGFEPAPYNADRKMQTPGFKVLHVTDVDFRSNCATLDDALVELREWSQRNAGHLPVIVTMNLNDQPAPFPNATEPAPFGAAALDRLDETIREGLSEDRLITPDLVRGDAETLAAAIRDRGWPRVDDVRGQFLFVIDEGGMKRRDYVDGHPSLCGRALFTTSEPGTPEAAVLIINDPLRDGQAIRQRVEQGYLVRTRADAETAEARAGDHSRFDASRVCGAQVISTDYPLPDERLGTGYSVAFEGGAYVRRNPVTATKTPASDPAASDPPASSP
ncbi:phosphatidylinositol-specific phospholipase C1-like protein [Botrimarina mediterranea]|nr:phosphatidylinositol-specific phospholipase C1-like protein [Botrimarina mediterranea]